MAVNTVIVDDNDARITYNGPWILGGNASVEFDGTTHRTLTAGATATFMFSGTSVSVFGTISSLSVSPVNPSSTYSIDGSKVATFAPTEDDSIHYMQQFFQSSPLASGSHTLIITSNADNGYLFLDFIQFTPSSNTSPTTLTKTTAIPPSASQSTVSVTLTTSQITTSLSQGSLGTSIIITRGSDTLVSSTTSQSSNSTLSQSSSFSIPATSAASSSRSSKAPVGAIVGGVIAAAALLVIVVIALCLIRRSRRTRQGWQNSGSTLTPFQNAAHDGSGSDNTMREGTNVGLHNTAPRLLNPRDGKTFTNLHGQGRSSPISPTLQSTTTEAPRYLQNQEVASGTDVDSPPEYDYGESRRPLDQVHGHSRSQ